MVFHRNARYEFINGFIGGSAAGLVFALVLTLGLGPVLLVLVENVPPAYIAFGITIGILSAVMFAISLGLLLGAAGVVLLVLGDSYDTATTSPRTLLAGDRTVAFTRTITTVVFMVGLTACSGNTVLDGFLTGLSFAASIASIRSVLSSWGGWLLFARLWLPLTGRLPWRPKRFLEDAHARGVLRTTGAVHQFHHARLPRRDHRC